MMPGQGKEKGGGEGDGEGEGGGEVEGTGYLGTVARWEDGVY